MTIQWPDWIPPNSIDFWQEDQTRSGGPSILGVERIISSPSTRWRATLTFRIWGTQPDPNRLLWWRSFASQMRGRSGSFTIGPFDRVNPYLLAGGVPDVPFGDLSSFSDNSFFASSASTCTVWIGGGVGARTMIISYTGAGAPQQGQYFGTGGTRLYMLETVSQNSNGSYTITFSPGLREVANAGDLLDFMTPRCTMRLAADDTARAKIALFGVSDTTLDLVEVF